MKSIDILSDEHNDIKLKDFLIDQDCKSKIKCDNCEKVNYFEDLNLFDDRHYCPDCSCDLEEYI